MEPRFNAATASPTGYKGLLMMEQYLSKCGLEEKLLHLIKLRVSQINGCAFCLDMHWKDLLAIGEAEQRLYLLHAWRGGPEYSDRDRAVLTWGMALTLLTNGH